MKRILGLWIAALAAVGGCNEAPKDILPAAPAGGLEKAQLSAFWETTPKDLAMVSGESLTAIYRLQDSVYCVTSTGRLVALDARTGVPRWAVMVAPADQKVYRPLHLDKMSLTENPPGATDMSEPKAAFLQPFDAVVINSSTQVLVIDRKTGKVVRRVNLPKGCSCAGTSDGPMFYAGSAGGYCYAISLEQAVKTWTSSVGDSIMAPMEYQAGGIYVATVDGKLHMLHAGGQSVEGTHKAVGGSLSAPFWVDNRGCFVPCGNNFLYAFSADLSTKLWDHPFACKGPLTSGVQVGERTVFQRADGDKLYAINLADGQERWGLPQGLQVVAAAGTDVYVRDTAGKVLQVDEIEGTIKASASLGGMSLFVGNTTEPMIIAATRSGRVACLKPPTAGTAGK